MDSDAGPPRTRRRIADRLRRSRDRRFVGRETELALVRDALRSARGSFTVAFLHGPGGVGKSALLRAAEDEARASGIRVARIDLRSIEPAPDAFCEAVGTQLDRTATQVAAGDLGPGRCMLLLDTYEAAGALDFWVREHFLPDVPADTLVLIAGRDRPGPGWSADRGWRDLLTVVPVRNLSPEDVRRLLEIEGVREGLHGRLLAASHGHPLALNLLIDVLEQQGADDASLDAVDWPPDVVQPLLERFVAGVPSPAHRDALRVGALARATTESLLRAALAAEDVGDVFGWLRGLSFIEEGAGGVFPHDLARDVLVQDGRWRDPDGYSRLHRAVHDYTVTTLGAPDAQKAATDLVFLHRNNPFAARMWDWRSLGDVYADRLRPDDVDTVLALAARFEGEQSAALVHHWIGRQPEGFLVFRGADGLAGFAASVALHEASAEDIEADPGTSAMWAFARRHAPPRPGDEVHASRFFLDAHAYQALASPSLNALTIASTQAWLARRRPSWELLGGYADPDAWAPLMDYIGFRREPDADCQVGGRRYGVHTHDWRRMGPQRWLEMMGDRETARAVAPAVADAGSRVLALSRVEFAQAVKRALRDLHRPGALAQNPLLSSRLIVDHPDERPAVDVLGDVVRQAVDTLGAHPRDSRLQRVLDRTFVRPAPTQERAAEVLDLPMSTYRRHLARGTERVTDWLWQRELYGWNPG